MPDATKLNEIAGAHDRSTLGQLAEILQELASALKQRGQMMATAESCTGGLIAGACTDLAGSSATGSSAAS
jgi:nicotinamide mononucleotide (NMN) deamidase PncC